MKNRPDVEQRGFRGLEIARRLRKGESVQTVRIDLPEEESLTFDYLRIFEKRLKRYLANRTAQASIMVANIPTSYDDFEIGVLGQAYDNLGMLKGDLPASEIPPHVTDAQLTEMIERGHESIRHRKWDQAALTSARGE